MNQVIQKFLEKESNFGLPYLVHIPVVPLKGGIPLSTDIPAPVITTTYSDLCTNCAICLIFFFKINFSLHSLI